MNVGASFAHICFLRTTPISTKDTISVIREILFYFKSDSIVDSFVGPFFTFGQYDIFFIINCDDMAKGSRAFYTLLDYVNYRRKKSITDFHVELGFEWEDINAKQEVFENDCEAYFSLKYNYGNNKKLNDDGLTNVLESLSDDIGNELNSKIKIYGSMSWHEIGVLVKNNCVAVFNSIAQGNTKKYIRDIRKIYFRSQTLRDTMDLEARYIDCHVGFKSSINCTELDSYFRKLNTRTDLLQSMNNEYISARFNSYDTYINTIDALCESTAINFTKTSFYTHKKKCDFNIHSEKTMLSQENENVLLKQNLLQKLYNRIDSVSVSKRKLYALRTSIRTLMANENYQYILPKKISKSITYIIKSNDISEETNQYYISEIESIIDQRLAGAQLDAVMGKDTRYNKGHTSYQRLLLACESLISRCFSLYITNHLHLNLPKAHLFILFDYGSRLSSHIPPDIAIKGFQDDMPLIIRLKMLKYKPWLWITGLRELGRLTYSITNRKPSFSILAQDPKMIDFEDDFLCQFLTFTNFKRLLLEEMQFFEKINRNKMVIKYPLQDVFIARTNKLQRKSRLIDNFVDKEQISFYQENMKKGLILNDLSPDKNFLNFINAYYGFSRKQQSETKTFISYVLSLYWQHSDMRIAE
ncbi:MAG: hypothetical protein AAGU21_06445 [Solidesulfovibrio sp.]|uniref:hypothetical protein n=1 Tax=Solidesulfovibrio sp. TaxID=2910990 RepID=UPI0031588639